MILAGGYCLFGLFPSLLVHSAIDFPGCEMGSIDSIASRSSLLTPLP